MSVSAPFFVPHFAPVSFPPFVPTFLFCVHSCDVPSFGLYCALSYGLSSALSSAQTSRPLSVRTSAKTEYHPIMYHLV